MMHKTETIFCRKCSYLLHVVPMFLFSHQDVLIHWNQRENGFKIKEDNSKRKKNEMTESNKKRRKIKRAIWRKYEKKTR